MLLDYIDGLELPDIEADARSNELNSLAYLWQGLEWLAGQTALIETELCRRFECEKTVAFVMGNHPAFGGIPMGLVACTFHWYAVSACNYVRLVGWLTHENDEVRASKYVERVIPRVLLWRNKVASHFAMTAPKPTGRTNDTPADLAASVMFPVAFYDRSLVASPLRLAFDHATGGSQSRNMEWGITVSHAALAERFHPVDRAL